MKSERMFYSTAAGIILLITVVGFFPFYTSGQGEGGRVIAPGIYPVVLVHGMAVTAWYVLSLVQSLLITVKNRRFHMKLGWSAVGLLPVVTVSGVLVAIRSTQGAPDFVFFGMRYPDFLLVMLAEIAVFTVLVLAGLLMRKRPEIHRSMMLCASLSLLLGATTRIPSLVSLFGGHDSRMAFFGPVFALAAVLLLVRSVMTRAFDRWFAAGFGFIVITFLAAEQLSRTEVWQGLTAVLLKG